MRFDLACLRRDRKRLLTVLCAVFFWGLFAHAYGFLNLTISHDSLGEFYAFARMGYYDGSVAQWKIALGRFLAPLYHLVFRGLTVAPWFSGVLSLIWLAPAAYLTAVIFDLRRTGALVLLGGIFTANLSFTALAGTYITDLDANMLAVLTAVGAVRCWQLGGKRCFGASPLLIVSLGIYQSMLSVYVTLVIFVCILQLLENSDCKTVFMNGLKAVGLLLAAGILYFLLSKAVCAACGLELTQQENGMAKLWNGSHSLFASLIGCYIDWISAFIFLPPVSNAAFHFGLFLFIGILLLLALLNRKLAAGNKLLLVLLFVILPLGMNAAGFLNGEAHELMMYAFWLVYLLGLLLCRFLPEWKGAEKARMLCGALVFVLLFSNARTANQLHVKKQIEQASTLSLMTRVVDRLEQTEGYDPGQTEVLFDGIPANQNLPAFKELYYIVGAQTSAPIMTEDFYQAYFDHYLQYPIRICDSQRRAELAGELDANAPAFPARGSIYWLGDTLVIKMQ